MVTLGGLPLAEAYLAIDMDVIVFLLGVMLMAGYLEEAGFFEWAAERVVERARSPRQLLAGVIGVSAGLSALFVNDTVCLVLTPLILDVLRPLGLRPAPYLVGLATAANTGSVLTVVGNPQNMLVAVRGGFDFLAFAVPMAPVALGALVLNWLVLAFVFRKELQAPLARAVHEPPVAVDWPLARRTLIVFAGALAGWLAGLSLPLVAISGGALAIVAARRDPHAMLARVEWPLLLFFAALFVLMRGLETTGATGALTAAAGDLLAGTGVMRASAVSLVVGALSNLVSNVPAVLLWAPVVPTLPEPEELWLLLAMSSTFAGNFLLIGSMANLIVAERAASRGERLGFVEYARAGVPLSLLSIAWGILWLA
jgi:Na+/H+ antiporter NhaD/arsenite permease-like protein